MAQQVDWQRWVWGRQLLCTSSCCASVSCCALLLGLHVVWSALHVAAASAACHALLALTVAAFVAAGWQGQLHRNFEEVQVTGGGNSEWMDVEARNIADMSGKQTLFTSTLVCNCRDWPYHAPASCNTTDQEQSIVPEPAHPSAAWGPASTESNQCE
jgi:hypothetical protein